MLSKSSPGRAPSGCSMKSPMVESDSSDTGASRLMGSRVSFISAASSLALISSSVATSSMEGSRPSFWKSFFWV